MQSFSQLNNLLEIACSLPLTIHQFLLPYNNSFMPAPCNTAEDCSASSLICHLATHCPCLDGSQKLSEPWQPTAALLGHFFFQCSDPVQCQECYVHWNVSYCNYSLSYYRQLQHYEHWQFNHCFHGIYNHWRLSSAMIANESLCH